MFFFIEDRRFVDGAMLHSDQKIEASRRFQEMWCCIVKTLPKWGVGHPSKIEPNSLVEERRMQKTIE